MWCGSPFRPAFLWEPYRSHEFRRLHFVSMLRSLTTMCDIACRPSSISCCIPINVDRLPAMTTSSFTNDNNNLIGICELPSVGSKLNNAACLLACQILFCYPRGIAHLARYYPADGLWVNWISISWLPACNHHSISMNLGMFTSREFRLSKVFHLYSLHLLSSYTVWLEGEGFAYINRSNSTEPN